MPRLTKIYTRAGDTGETGLGDGARVSKASLRVEAYGEVDEANSAIGLARESLRADGTHPDLAGALDQIQQDLFDLGADLCVPRTAAEKPGEKLRITDSQVAALERRIDAHNAALAALDSFILPGGTEAAARLHLARAVTRRAERRVAALLAADPGSTNPLTLVYLNRLSDLLFVLARVAAGGRETLWRPGSTREGGG